MIPVVIAGGGPLGLSLALLLRQAGIRSVVFDARRAGAGHLDRRLLALSAGTRQILARTGAWSQLRTTPITRVHVSQHGALGRTRIDAAQMGLAALGHVTPAGRLIAALETVCAQAGIEVHHEARLLDTQHHDTHLQVRIAQPAGERLLTTQLLARADGAIPDAIDADVVRQRSSQQALVAEVSLRQAPDATAWERFTPDGPVALLPLEQGFGLIWSASAERIARLRALDEKSFLRELGAVFAGRFEFTALGERSCFPLGLRYRRTPVGARTVWLGNAAQTLHSVGGQGFNLALRDAFGLASQLSHQHGDCGAQAVLARHARQRHDDRQALIGFTDALVRGFTLPGWPLRHARGAGLLALDLSSWGRQRLARFMMHGLRGRGAVEN